MQVASLISEEVGINVGINVVRVAKVANSINVEVGIFWRKKLVHNCYKRGVEGGKNPTNQ